MKWTKITTLLTAGIVAGFIASAVGAQQAMKPIVQKNCLNCHKSMSEMDNILAGNLSGKVMKAHSLQLKINNRMQLVKFNEKTIIENVPSIKALKGEVALRVHYEMEGNHRIAKKIVVKPKFDVPEDQLISTKELAKLVAQGPEKGGYTLLDSRPPAGFMKGHIPTAISMPLPKMKEMMGKLPKEKDALVIFYCQGYR